MLNYPEAQRFWGLTVIDLYFLVPHSHPTIALIERKFFLCRSITLPTARAAVTRGRAQTEQSCFLSLPWSQPSSVERLKLSAQIHTCIQCPERWHALLPPNKSNSFVAILLWVQCQKKILNLHKVLTCFLQ